MEKGAAASARPLQSIRSRVGRLRRVRDSCGGREIGGAESLQFHAALQREVGQDSQFLFPVVYVFRYAGQRWISPARMAHHLDRATGRQVASPILDDSHEPLD